MSIRRRFAPLLGWCTVVLLVLYHCEQNRSKPTHKNFLSIVPDSQNVNKTGRGKGIDVVILTARFSCVVESTLRGLQRFLNPPPRRFVVITTAYHHCEAFKELLLGTALECLHQDEVVPGLTLAAVQAYLDATGVLAGRSATTGNTDGMDSVAALTARHVGATATSSPSLATDPHTGATYMGRSTAGWYLQQFLKLGAPGSLAGLGDLLLLWDSDMVPTRAVTLFDAGGRPYLNIGGNVVASYEQAFCRLGLGPYRLAPDGTSFVAHNAVVAKRHLAEMLDAIARRGSAGGCNAAGCAGNGTMKAVGSLATAPHALAPFAAHSSSALSSRCLPPLPSLASPASSPSPLPSRSRPADAPAEASPHLAEEEAAGGWRPASSPDDLSSWPDNARVTPPLPAWATTILDVAAMDAATLHLGFSEYATYASFMLNLHPDQVAVRRHKTWTRHPLGGYGVVPDASGRCCPTRLVLMLSSLLGNEYTGFEAGHYSYCNVSATSRL